MARNPIAAPLLIALFVVLGTLPGGRAAVSDGGLAPPEPGSYLLKVQDVSVRRLGGPDTIAVLSPDGTMAAVATGGGGPAALRIVTLATNEVSDVLVTDQGAVRQPVWSPDGR